MLGSTANWKPLLNGYSGITPHTYDSHFEALKNFPDDASVAALRGAGVTHVFVHLDQLDPAEGPRLQARADLRRLAAEGTVALYRLEP
jgi:hypothetical protein